MAEKKSTPPDKRRQESTLVKERTSIPRQYKVLLHNDDFTPMEFVVHVLETLFRRSPAEASRIMLLVHRTGIGVAGVFSYEVAETKAAQTVELARANNYPLLATTEPEE